MHAQTIIKRPLLTEKGARLRETGGGADRRGRGRGVRAEGPVRGRSRREQDRDPQAVEELFNVKVTDVRTLDRARQGEARRSVHRQRPSWKKAIVTLKAGDNIEFFEGV